MSKYLKAGVQTLRSIRDQADKEPNPLHAAMLRNYYRHVALEVTGCWDRFVKDDSMMVEHPVYNIRMGEETRVLDGVGGVSEFYTELDDSMFFMVDHRTAVDDWGVASLITSVQIATGEFLRGQGLEVEKPEAVYALEDITLAQFWRYDNRARLEGEDLYAAAPHKRIVEIPPGEVFTKADLRAAFEEFFEPIPAL
ncbi:hypothetical protein ACFHW2_40590 [Actinomadura sp. LOL_016]|uniref:hypothetical protein n=1 Tax=unclassified Actinomadura TaxID=2626254 RepID=UPI003A7F6803